MATLQASDLADLLLVTQEGLVKRGAFVNMQTDLTDFVGVREIWKNKKKAFFDGINWRFDIQMDQNYSFKTVGLYETDGSAMNDTMVKGYVSARHCNAHYEYDLHEPDFQLGGTAIVDFIMSKYSAMMVSWYVGLEDLIWGSPAASNTKDPHGIPFWVQKGTSGQEGFYGLDPAGYTSGRANILSSTYPRWANYFADYTDVSTEDLIRKMRKCTRKIAFRSPLSHKEPNFSADTKNGIYCNEATISLLEEQLRGQNMNLGMDLDPTGDRALFQSQKLVYAPKLDSDTSDPIYFLDWKTLAVGCMPGWEDKISKPYVVPGKHLVYRVDKDATLEFISTDLRRQAVFAKV